jgi:hypothetical protein
MPVTVLPVVSQRLGDVSCSRAANLVLGEIELLQTVAEHQIETVDVGDIVVGDGKALESSIARNRLEEQIGTLEEKEREKRKRKKTFNRLYKMRCVQSQEIPRCLKCIR